MSYLSTIRRLISASYVLRLQAVKPDFDRQMLRKSIFKAMQVARVREGIRNAMGMGRKSMPDDVQLVATRAIASSSLTCGENHYTLQVFGAKTGKWIGGVHTFPTGSKMTPTFKSWKDIKNRTWKGRTLIETMRLHVLVKM